MKEAEAITQAVVDTKRLVYAKDTPLADAKEINGLRAVFDEVTFKLRLLFQ